jgi:hypothetical protein
MWEVVERPLIGEGTKNSEGDTQLSRRSACFACSPLLLRQCSFQSPKYTQRYQNSNRTQESPPPPVVFLSVTLKLTSHRFALSSVGTKWQQAPPENVQSRRRDVSCYSLYLSLSVPLNTRLRVLEEKQSVLHSAGTDVVTCCCHWGPARCDCN